MMMSRTDQIRYFRHIDLMRSARDSARTYRMEGLWEGRAEGRAEERAKMNKEIVTNMLAKGFDIALIAEITNLTEKDIKKIGLEDLS